MGHRKVNWDMKSEPDTEEMGEMERRVLMVLREAWILEEFSVLFWLLALISHTTPPAPMITCKLSVIEWKSFFTQPQNQSLCSNYSVFYYPSKYLKLKDLWTVEVYFAQGSGDCKVQKHNGISAHHLMRAFGHFVTWQRAHMARETKCI